MLPFRGPWFSLRRLRSGGRPQGSGTISVNKKAIPRQVVAHDVEWPDGRGGQI